MNFHIFFNFSYLRILNSFMVYWVCSDNEWFTQSSKNRKPALYFEKMTFLDIVLSKTNVTRRLR